MKYKILLVLALGSILFFSLTVNSLSSYSTVSSFSTSITPDTDKIQQEKDHKE